MTKPVRYIGGQDSYEIVAAHWSNDPEDFPPLTYIDIANYLVLGRSPFYNISEFDYKGL